MIREWDENDAWAERLSRWNTLSRELTRQNPNYIPSCFECYGTGHRIKDLLSQELVVCRKCKGTGLRRARPRFLDEEIRDIVARIVAKKGEHYLRTLVQQYVDGRRKS